MSGDRTKAIYSRFEEQEQQMIKKIKGTNDILPGELGDGIFITEAWHYLEQSLKETAFSFGYGEIRTPVFEMTELFVKGIGDVTDIVQKEMFSFTDRGERQLTLRPEGTASVVRSFIENSLGKKSGQLRLFYCGPMFRAERPQKGRYRQFHQFGVERIGSADAAADVEVIALFWTMLKRLGLSSMELLINSVGCPECRPAYHKKLQEYFSDKLENLCSDCRDRYGKNILRMLDCKVPGCQETLNGAPSVGDSLCGECGSSYSDVKQQLENLGISYTEQPRLVRGLDYYTKTAFEIVHAGIGAQATIVGGGRYDGLIGSSGGPETPAVGGAFGLERVLLSLEAEGKLQLARTEPDIFMVLFDREKEPDLNRLLFALRSRGIRAAVSEGSRQVGKQLKAADRSGACHAVFVGGEEWDSGSVLIKDLKTQEQTVLPLDGKNPETAVEEHLNRL